MDSLFGDRWKTIKTLGEGGQGVVYQVRDSTDSRAGPEVISDALKHLHGINFDNSHDGHYERLRQGIKDVVDSYAAENFFALKVIHDPKDATDPECARQRIDTEIEVMSQSLHPHLLKLLTHGEEKDGRKWYVSEFHPGGTLDERSNLFQGDVNSAIRALHPIVEAVATLHEQGFVHRDIKPHNIFLDANGDLILGDFGLVFRDDDESRVSATFGNVGSRDWMPGWAQSVKLEDVKPTFDVFSLGKVLWSMVSGLPVLQLWYFDRQPNDLTETYPYDPNVRLLNRLLGLCVVENEEDCLPNAKSLLSEIDSLLLRIELGGEDVADGATRHCRVCGEGDYALIVDRGRQDALNFGIQSAGRRTFKVFACDNCGHIQLFFFDEDRDAPPAWPKDD